MKLAVTITAFLITLMGSSPAFAEDAAAGQALYKKACASCHGPTGKGMASFPKLVGHPAEYLTERLEGYRAGKKYGPNTALMAPMAKSLSDDDIGNVVAFLAAKSG